MKFGLYLSLIATAILVSQGNTVHLGSQIETTTEFADIVEAFLPVVNLLIKKIFPFDLRQKKKMNTQSINCLDANVKTQETGGAYGQGSEGSATPSKQEGSSAFGMPTDMKTFFGGAFFSQLDSDEVCDKLHKWDSFLPQVAEMDDEEVLAQFMKISGEAESDLLAEVEATTKEFASIDSRDKLVMAVRILAEIDNESDE